MKVLDILGKSKKAIIGVISIILFVVAIFYAGTLFGNHESKDKITTTTIKNQMVEINEVAVYSYEYSKVGKFSNNLSISGWDIPLTQKSFLITYDGTIKAGVNMNDAKISIKNDIISIVLPESTILSNEIDESSIEVYDEQNNLFNQISINDYKSFATKEKRKVSKEAVANGILNKSNDRIESIITKYLYAIPEVKDTYKINISFAKEK